MKINEEALEQAARYLCELRGLDPDEEIPHGPAPNSDNSIHSICLYSPAWKLTANEIHDQLLMREALHQYEVIAALEALPQGNAGDVIHKRIDPETGKVSFYWAPPAGENNDG